MGKKNATRLYFQKDKLSKTKLFYLFNSNFKVNRVNNPIQKS